MEEPRVVQDASWQPLESLTVRLRGSGGLNKYPAKAHARRVAVKLPNDDALIALAARKNVNWPNSDMPAPFRQDRYFYYLTGCNEPDCHVTYNIKQDRLTLWLPPVDGDWRHVVYYGNGSTVEEALEKYDVDDARYIKREELIDAFGVPCADLLHSAWQKEKTSLQPSFLLLSHPTPRDTLMTVPIYMNTLLLRVAMDACRVVKDEFEIDLVRKANEVTAAAHVNVFKGMHRFSNESEVEAAYMQTCIAWQAKEQAYDPIAGSGPNAAVLHYSENRAHFGNGETLVLDAGCEVERYGSDVTRTIPINKKNPGYWPSPEAENIYDLVETVQESCIKQMLPGNRYIDTQFHAHHLVIEGLLKLGILKGDAKEIFHAGTSMAFLPHGLGHHLGLDVHDVSPNPPPPYNLWTGKQSDTFMEDLKAAYVNWDPKSASYVDSLTEPEHFAMRRDCHYLTRPNAPLLEPGMIVTVEPGIYFNDYLLKHFLKDPEQSKFINPDVLKKYIPVGGVRIEDDILITEDGYENLTTAPKGANMLRMIQQSAREKM